MLLADNDERLSWLSSEGGLFDMLAGRYSGGIPNLDIMLKAHAGDHERVGRGSRPPVYLRHPALTVGLSPQHSVLRGLVQKPGFRGRGLLGRFLYLLPDSPIGRRTLDGPPIPADLEREYSRLLTRILDREEEKCVRPLMFGFSPRTIDRSRGLPMNKRELQSLIHAYRKMVKEFTPAQRNAWNALREEVWTIADTLVDLSFFESIPVPRDKAERLKALAGLLPAIEEDSFGLSGPLAGAADHRGGGHELAQRTENQA